MSPNKHDDHLDFEQAASAYHEPLKKLVSPVNTSDASIEFWMLRQMAHKG